MRRLYGAPPLHLLGHLAAFALAGYAVVQILDLDQWRVVLLWLVAAVVLHDAVLWPLYSGADRAGQRLLGSAINHVRVPLGLSLMLALVFIGVLTGKGESSYSSASGREWDGYVTRWLVVTAVLFGISALVWAWRRRAR